MRDSLRNIYLQEGSKRFTARMVNMINEGKINADNFSLKALWDAMGQPRLMESRVIDDRPISEKDFEMHEALDSTAFPKITGALINKIVQDSYQYEYGIGMNLVTKIPSSQKDDTIVGYTHDDKLIEVAEGMEYQEGAIGEKYHKINNRKFGRIISLTAEMVKFDQTAQMINRARMLGERAKAAQEEQIMRAVCETASTGVNASWRPLGNATTLYSNTSTDPFTGTTQDNLITDVLADETDLTAAMVEFGSMVDEAGDPIVIQPRVLLVPVALYPKAAKILKSMQSVEKTAPAGVYNVFSQEAAIQPYQSAWIDNLISSTAWYFGDLKKQFVYTEVFPLQVMQERPGNDSEFKRDEIFRFKVRYMGGCGAVTNRYVIKSTGGG